MQQELIEMLDKMIKHFEYISTDSYYAKETDMILSEAEKLIEKAKNNNAPAVPQGWRAVLVPTEWTIGPNLFKDWCSQWFGPDAGDDHLMRAAHALLDLAATPAPEPAQEVGLTGDEIEAIAKKHMSTVSDHWCNEEAIRERYAEDFARAIIDALRAKGGK